MRCWTWSNLTCLHLQNLCFQKRSYSPVLRLRFLHIFLGDTIKLITTPYWALCKKNLIDSLWDQTGWITVLEWKCQLSSYLRQGPSPPSGGRGTWELKGEQGSHSCNIWALAGQFLLKSHCREVGVSEDWKGWPPGFQRVHRRNHGGRVLI